MRKELKTLAHHRLARAREAFAEGDHLLAAGAARGATSRFYYAAFFAARSADPRRLQPGGMFNVIDTHEGDKEDFWLLTDDPFDRTRFERRYVEVFG